MAKQPHFDCCPTCGADASEELDEMAARAKLTSEGTLVARCECGQLFRAVPDVIWRTNKIEEH